VNLEFISNNRNAVVKELKRDGNIFTISVDGKVCEVDIVKFGNQEYSVLSKGKSYNVEVVENAEPKHYSINVCNTKHEIEVIDNETRYMQNRSNGDHENGDSIIKSPMPGRIVKVLVKAGDKVEAGQAILILSAMKMESEFKAGRAGIVTEIAVKEGDIVDGNQLLVVIEELI